jgi:hypothetical protein
MAPVVDVDGARRGVVAEGPAGRVRALRYEVRCWCGGVTAYGFAVDSPRRSTTDLVRARRVLELGPAVARPQGARALDIEITGAADRGSVPTAAT